ncbi:hypothetical protein FOA52_011909 [Chlamydomonas sp. UWO 241]|nr:hypothetical protein FOA52_011909 [Chlamydomonas sp. UWO 241]
MWERFRSHILPAPGTPGLPALDAIVVVEGVTDANAVHAALNATVFVCDGDKIRADAGARELAALAALNRNVIILTDPDREGRDIRAHVSQALCAAAEAAARVISAPGEGGYIRFVWHAFVPVAAATSVVDNSRHEAGNAGVEYAAPAAIAAAIKSARPTYPPGRAVFCQEKLERWGLVNSFDAKLTNGAKRRRELFGNALGVGTNSGSSLVKILNRFFSEEEALAAMESVKAQIGAEDAAEE